VLQYKQLYLKAMQTMVLIMKWLER